MRNIDTSSFLAFFWSDNEDPHQGGFSIQVGCEAASVSSMEDNLDLTGDCLQNVEAK